jgi:hypothetical protein
MIINIYTLKRTESRVVLSGRKINKKACVKHKKAIV